PRAGSTTDDLFRAYIADRKAAGRYSEKMDFNRAAVNPVFGHLLPRSIRREDCLAHIVRRREAGISDGTIWTELTTLRTALNHAVRMGWIDRAPYITIPPKPDPREHHLSRAEARRLLDSAMAPHIKLFIELALGTAGRTEAILDLTWDRVDFMART